MNVVIMAGGRGTRFWPSSTTSKPKQFLPLLSNKSMLQETYKRFRQWLPEDRIFVATIDAYVGLVKEQLPELSTDRLIIEPVARDTGPCTALTALFFLHQEMDDVIVMVPSDQYISDYQRLRNALEAAEQEALHNRTTVMLGIVPSRPETGYGYIRTSESSKHRKLRSVSSFIEKPSLSVADELVRLPGTYWNSGIFVWRPSTIAHLMNRFCPSIWSPLSEHYPHTDTIYSTIPKLSVDYAIIEKAPNLFVIPVDFEWDDVGTWNSVRRHYGTDPYGNLLNGYVNSFHAKDNIVISDKHTAVIGVRDLIIISTEDGLLVCHRSEEQRIKEVINESMHTWESHQLKEVKPTQ
ncbi:mannose-1-phosphate guanylyltransferase [Paenibacillus taiwanensis]|uniref:mannose-1-phosphate guanylyltransferase n=1 Tax=Paenibacillus taiwanensis TaxID=401638 RepID=UPI00042326E8|nr:sugar phosphate nucleotidyltransferase [Paenibacillus taiwanensis]